MKHAVILTDEISLMIAVQIDQYVIIGPELSSGIQPAITRAAFKSMVQPDKLLDPNDEIRSVFKSTFAEPIELILCVYFCIADYCDALHLVPAPLSTYAQYFHAQKIENVFIAKYIHHDLSKVDISKSRDVFYARLAGIQTKIIIENKDGCLLSPYQRDIIIHAGIEDFDATLQAVAERILEFAKEYGFIHGKCHVGHVAQSGAFIDFGDAFSFREPEPLAAYLQKYLPPHLRALALEKAAIHNTDMVAMCTLLEMYCFLDSIIGCTAIHPEFLLYAPRINAMKKWLIDAVTEYLAADISIFTFFRQRDPQIIGGFEAKFGLPPAYEKIHERFPIEYFIDEIKKPNAPESTSGKQRTVSD